MRAGDLMADALDFTPKQVVAGIYPSLPLDAVWRMIAFAQGEHAPWQC